MRDEVFNLFCEQTNLSSDERQIIIDSIREKSTCTGINIFDTYENE